MIIQITTVEFAIATLPETPHRNQRDGYIPVLSPAECQRWNMRLDAWLASRGIRKISMADAIRADCRRAANG